MMPSISEEIRERRHAAGLTQRELAEAAIVSTSSVRRIEDRQRLPRHRSRVVALILRALDDLEAASIPAAETASPNAKEHHV